MMDRLLREGNPPTGQLASPVPQAWNPAINDFQQVTGQDLGGGRFGADGVQWGKTASGLFVPVRVTNDGVQEVQLSGTNVLIASGASFEVAPGSASPTHAARYDYKNFTWLYVRVLAHSAHDFDVEQDVPGYIRLKIANKASPPRIVLSDPFRPLGTDGRIWISNKSLDPQKYDFQIFGMTG